jgi:DNA helicase-2/ATP-dependent DNA helicase PcrA
MPHHYDLTLPWNVGVQGKQVLAFINDDFAVFRMQAGAGTGKTFGLRRRVLRIRHPGGLNVPHERVLVCAFNRVIARDLERDVRAELEPLGLALPAIKTIHALCSMLLGGQLPRLLLSRETEEMLYDVLETHAVLRTQYSHPAAVRALREHEAGFRDHTALMQAVRRWLGEHGAGLIGDVPRRVDAAIRAGELQDRYDHILADEWQDLTETETHVVVGLRAAGASLAALGDRKQSIYAFRGNYVGGLDGLTALVQEPITEGTMDECRRCPGVIVALGNSVMALEGEPLRPVHEGGQLHRVRWNTPTDEADGMGREIARVYRAAAPHATQLVLVTRRAWGYAVRNAIRRVDDTLPVQTVFAEDALETWPAREAFVFLSILGEPRDAVTLRDWIAYQQPQEGKDYLAPKRNAPAYLRLQAEGGALTRERARELADRPLAGFQGAGRGNVLLRLQRLRDLLVDVPLDDTPASLVAHVLDPDRWVDFAGEEADLAREDITRLRIESERIIAEPTIRTLGDVVRQLRYRVATREPIGAEDAGGVRIVTMWGAKGLTADYVYLVGLCDEALPGPHDEQSTGLTEAQHNDEQRRLLYVSVTRARKALVLSRPTKIKRGQVKTQRLLERSAGGRWWQSLTDTRFFIDIRPPTLPNTVSGEAWAGVELPG